MVEVERETFTVTTIGTGHPDYSTPVAAPATRALTVLFPEREVAGKRYDDFAKIDFTATLTAYVIGTNANAARSGGWPTGTVAKEIAFLATKPCKIRFNNSDAVEHEIPEGIIIRSFKRVERFYVIQDGAPGTLRAWIEG